MSQPGGNGIVQQIVAGTNITVTPAGGTGVVTVNASGGGGGAVSSVFTRTGAVVATGGDYAVGQITGAAPLASPALTGNPTAPTQSPGDNSTKLATTAYVAANSGGLVFPYTIIQSDAQIFGAGTSFTYTFPAALQASGATAILIFGVDGTATFTPPAGWTVGINESSGGNFPRLVVCLIASAGQTSVAFSGASMIPSLIFYELAGTRTFDITTGTGFAATGTNVVFPSITPTAGAAVFSATTAVNASGSVSQYSFTPQPGWNPLSVSAPVANERVLAGNVYTGTASGAAIVAPTVSLAFAPLSASGIAYAVWSIK